MYIYIYHELNVVLRLDQGIAETFCVSLYIFHRGCQFAVTAIGAVPVYRRIRAEQEGSAVGTSNSPPRDNYTRGL